MDNTNWTPAATTTALALARAYGHGWADFAVRDDDGALDVEATEDAQTDAERERAVPGLRPSLTHTTSSGRLSWQVAPDGSVRLSITRPLSAITPFAEGLDGYVVVAVATLSPLAATYSWWSRPRWGAVAPPSEMLGWAITVDSVAELFEERHSEALGSAIFAVLGRDLEPTRTAPVLRDGETWRVAQYVEIDEHEFWLRDVPEPEPGVELVSRRSA